ncbi:MAG: helix-turn-helix transcriptional regulator [Bacilli bacterium]
MINTLFQLGNRIKFLREGRLFSQEDFANEININRNYLSDIENGRRNPTIKILSKIASGLEVTLSELLKGVE